MSGGASKASGAARRATCVAPEPSWWLLPRLSAGNRSRRGYRRRARTDVLEEDGNIKTPGEIRVSPNFPVSESASLHTGARLSALSFAREIARSNRQRRGKCRAWSARSPPGFERQREREGTMELCSIVSGRLRPRATWGGHGDNTRVCARVHGRATRARAQRDGTDGRYSIAVCRICSLCRDHVLVLIRAPDKIALCYRGSCLRDPREKRERERENHHTGAFTYSLSSDSFLFPSPSLRPSRAYPRVLPREENGTRRVRESTKITTDAGVVVVRNYQFSAARCHTSAGAIEDSEGGQREVRR